MKGGAPVANIALLNRCNLRCPYCFADNYIADERTDITLDTFKVLLDFCAPEGELGIIGGEPLLHKEFDSIMSLALNDYRFNRITVFTNGVNLHKHLNAVNDRRVMLLINVNSQRDMGQGAFYLVDSNIDLLFKSGFSGSISIGINVYEENQDFTDFLYLVKKYGFKKIRLSVVIPHQKSEGGIKYFMRMKPTLFNLYRELKALGVSPCYDCNAIPECVYTEEEKSFLQTLPFANDFERQIFCGERSVCSPVIDLYPDLSATRCFGCYDMARADIREFENIFDLKNYFFKEIDARLVHNYSWEKCKDCYKYKTFGCFGGCLCYK
ncbi:MAG: radical SAM protein [Ruminococcaceae bacterium]|nr:radical SAM protein [Oscillospiraceae bacterium]